MQKVKFVNIFKEKNKLTTEYELKHFVIKFITIVYKLKAENITNQMN